MTDCKSTYARNYDKMSELMNKFSVWLLKELEVRDMTQSQLARATGLSRQAISYYLGEKSKRPDDDALKQIARAFKIPPEQIYRAAGLLPTPANADEETEKIIYESQDLTEQEKEEVLAFIRLKKNLRKKK